MPTETAERNRLGPDDWAEGALALIAEEGVGALSVEALARRLGVTKGSFYWHFPRRDALLDAALGRWEREGENDLLREIASLDDPRQRLRQLFRRVAAEVQTHRIHAALLKSLEVPRVRSAVEHASIRYLDILTATYHETGMAAMDARNAARLAYAAYLGFLQMNLVLGRERLSHAEFDAYVAHVSRVLIPPV
ncbi:MAG TPA: helix-turn-helix domain-containing protein [Rhodanobacteraceae bacterium]|nr:helix-turn-helix domain-containing protein [Rhodanobacteraceae bacterium]